MAINKLYYSYNIVTMFFKKLSEICQVKTQRTEGKQFNDLKRTLSVTEVQFFISKRIGNIIHNFSSIAYLYADKCFLTIQHIYNFSKTRELVRFLITLFYKRLKKTA